MTYVTDNSAIKTAQDNVDNAEFAIAKRGIQDQIDDYDNQIDGLNKQVDGLNKVIDGYNKEIDSLNKVIDGYNKQIDSLNKIIDKSNAYYDGEIKNVQKLQSEWEKALSLEERSINRVNFESMFGSDSVAKLLSGNLSMINQWKESYTGVLKDIDLETNGTVGDIAKQFSVLAGVDLSNATSQTQAIIDQYEVLKKSISVATSAIGATETGGNSEGVSEGANSLVGAIDASYQVASEKIPAEAEMINELTDATKLASSAIGGDSEKGDKKDGQSDSTNSLVGAIDASYETASEKLPAETEMMDGLTDSTVLANTEVNSLGEAINALEDKTVTITIKTVGSVPNLSSIGGAGASGSAHTNGTAHVEGTAKVTGDWGIHQGGKTLVGELGQEIVVRNGRFFTVGDNGAEFVDLQKGDIVFNHLQSKELLSKGNIVGRGNALAEGTVLQKAELPSYLRPIQEGDKGYELIKAARVYQDMLKTNIMLPINSIDKNVEMMTRNISNVSTNNVNKPTLTINGGINVSCPGVNSQEIMNQVKTAMHREIGGIALEALQEASITR